MDNKNLPAYPQPIAECNGGITDTLDYDRDSAGISKREYFAGLAMQGLLANPASGNDTNAIISCAFDAVRCADFLLSELSKPQP